jgi:hypothetical protein
MVKDTKGHPRGKKESRLARSWGITVENFVKGFGVGFSNDM